MSEFTFVKISRNELPFEGEIETPDQCATIKYAIDTKDKDVHLTIDEQYLSAKDVQYLVDFLTAVQKEIA